jgi:uncharacterized protein YaiI (UPF0178 family)
MEAVGPKLRIFVDADACPVKDEVYRVASRHGLTVFVVANSPIVVPRATEIERVVVGAGTDAADDWIAERAGPGAIVVTSDIPLASRCVKLGADVIAPNGKRFSESSIGNAQSDGSPALDRPSDIGTQGLSPPRPVKFPQCARQRGRAATAFGDDALLMIFPVRSGLFTLDNRFYQE